MADRCPHLDYRAAAGDREFDTERAYCTVVDRFVQPVRADVCNHRYDLRPAEHCEFYRDHDGIGDGWPEDGGSDEARNGDDDGAVTDGDGDDGDPGSGSGTGTGAETGTGSGTGTGADR